MSNTRPEFYRGDPSTAAARRRGQLLWARIRLTSPEPSKGARGVNRQPFSCGENSHRDSPHERSLSDLYAINLDGCSLWGACDGEFVGSGDRGAGHQEGNQKKQVALRHGRTAHGKSTRCRYYHKITADIDKDLNPRHSR